MNTRKCIRCKINIIEPKNQNEHESVSSGFNGSDPEICCHCVSDMANQISSLEKLLEQKDRKLDLLLKAATGNGINYSYTNPDLSEKLHMALSKVIRYYNYHMGADRNYADIFEAVDGLAYDFEEMKQARFLEDNPGFCVWGYNAEYNLFFPYERDRFECAKPPDKFWNLRKCPTCGRMIKLDERKNIPKWDDAEKKGGSYNKVEPHRNSWVKYSDIEKEMDQIEKMKETAEKLLKK